MVPPNPDPFNRHSEPSASADSASTAVVESIANPGQNDRQLREGDRVRTGELLIIFGLMAATLSALVVVPCLYLLFTPKTENMDVEAA